MEVRGIVFDFSKYPPDLFFAMSSAIYGAILSLYIAVGRSDCLISPAVFIKFIS